MGSTFTLRGSHALQETSSLVNYGEQSAERQGLFLGNLEVLERHDKERQWSGDFHSKNTLLTYSRLEA